MDNGALPASIHAAERSICIFFFFLIKNLLLKLQEDQAPFQKDTLKPHSLLSRITASSSGPTAKPEWTHCTEVVLCLTGTRWVDCGSYWLILDHIAIISERGDFQSMSHRRAHLVFAATTERWYPSSQVGRGRRLRPGGLGPGIRMQKRGNQGAQLPALSTKPHGLAFQCHKPPPVME